VTISVTISNEVGIGDLIAIGSIVLGSLYLISVAWLLHRHYERRTGLDPNLSKLIRPGAVDEKLWTVARELESRLAARKDDRDGQFNNNPSWPVLWLETDHNDTDPRSTRAIGCLKEHYTYAHNDLSRRVFARLREPQLVETYLARVRKTLDWIELHGSRRDLELDPSWVDAIENDGFWNEPSNDTPKLHLSLEESLWSNARMRILAGASSGYVRASSGVLIRSLSLVDCNYIHAIRTPKALLDKPAYDDHLVRVVGWQPIATETSGGAGIRLLTQRTLYSSQRSSLERFRLQCSQPDETRMSLKELMADQEFGLAVHVGIVSSDGFLILTRRSSDATLRAGRWSSTANGALSVAPDRGDRDLDGFGNSDPTAAAIRELSEEIGDHLEVRTADLVCHALVFGIESNGRDDDPMAGYFLAYEGRTHLSALEIAQGHRLGVSLSEGAHEVGHSILCLPIASEEERVASEALLNSLLDSSQITRSGYATARIVIQSHVNNSSCAVRTHQEHALSWGYLDH
jgi:hypothetical protein